MPHPSYEQQYLQVLNSFVIRQNEVEGDRTGTGTIRDFGAQLMADLRDGFPLLTTKKVFLRGVAEELLWFLRGETNIKSLQDKGVHIWDEWATEEGELGPVYGAMWRRWEGEEFQTDQIADVLDQLANNPTSRRILVTGWNPDLLPDSRLTPSENAGRGSQALPPCHTMFQFFATRISNFERLQLLANRVSEQEWEDIGVNYQDQLEAANDYGIPEYYLDCKLYQRSADWFLGVPFNVASYALLTHIIAGMVNMVPRRFIHTFGDTHLYANHIEQAKEQLSREPGSMPRIAIDRLDDIHDPDELTWDDIHLSDYNPAPAIKAPVSV